MSNELLFLAITFGGLSTALLMAWLGKQWLYAYIILIITYLGIAESKVIEVLGLPLTLGTALYGVVFFATDILTENYGKRTAFQIIRISIAISILLQILLLLTRLTTPIADVQIISDAMDMVFSSSMRLVAAGTFAYLISQHLDVYLYDFIHQKTGNKHLWLRNNGSTLISQGVDSYLFTFLGFYGVFDEWFLMASVAYAVKIFVALNDTVFIYLTKLFIPQDLKNKE